MSLIVFSFHFFSFFVAFEIVINSFGLIWAAFFFCFQNTNAEIYIRQILFLRNISCFVVAVFICYVFRNRNQRTELIVSNKSHMLRFLSFFHFSCVRLSECKQSNKLQTSSKRDEQKIKWEIVCRYVCQI